jgi:hypothetical protein
MHNAESTEVTTCRVHRGTARTIDAVGVDVILPPPCSKAGCRRAATTASAHGECEYHQRVREHRERHRQRVALFRKIHDGYRAVRGQLAMAHPAVMREMQRVAMRVFHHLINFGVEQTEENIRAVVAIFPMRDDEVRRRRMSPIGGWYAVFKVGPVTVWPCGSFFFLLFDRDQPVLFSGLL